MELQEVLADLLTVYTQAEIGNELGLNQATISKMRLGQIKSLKFNEGLKLMELHKGYTKKKKREA